VTLRDDRSKRCDDERAIATGRGKIIGTGRLTGTLEFRCETGRRLDTVRTFWVAGEGNATLTEANGIVWRRRGT
jgi:hypothetical protein